MYKLVLSQPHDFLLPVSNCPEMPRRHLGTPELPTPSPATTAPSRLIEALTQLFETMSMIQSQLSTSATTQVAFNKSCEDKIAMLDSQIGRDRARDRQRRPRRPSDARGPRPPPVVCTYCNRRGHSVGNCYTKERADRAASSRPIVPSAYMSDAKAPE